MKKVYQWAISMQTDIDIGDKLGFSHFNKKRRFPDIYEISLTLYGEEGKKAPNKEVKLLGIFLDRRLEFKAHTSNVVNKSVRMFRVVRVLGGTIRGVRGLALRFMYFVCV